MFLVSFKDSARKELLKLPNKELEKVLIAIELLQMNTRPIGVKKLAGVHHHYWRIRVGNYRVVYSIEDKIKIVTIIRIGHRKDIYD